MRMIFLLAGLCLAIAAPAAAKTVRCHSACAMSYRLTSASETRRYGILIAAPAAGRSRVRFLVEDEAAIPLGQTPPLAPGELAVVRIGRGFAAGDYRLAIAAVGCDTRPAATRRVTLDKRSPDHGWRSAPD